MNKPSTLDLGAISVADLDSDSATIAGRALGFGDLVGLYLSF